MANEETLNHDGIDCFVMFFFSSLRLQLAGCPLGLEIKTEHGTS